MSATAPTGLAENAVPVLGRAERRPVTGRDDPPGREPVEGDAEDEDQVQPEPERRQRVEDVAEQGHRLVEERIAVDRGVDPEQDGDPDPQDECRAGQDERRRDPTGDELGDGLPGLDAVAQVAVDDPVRPAAERRRQDVQATLLRQEGLGHRLVAVEDPEPAAELHHPVPGLLDDRRVGVGGLEAPASEPGVDLLLGDPLVALELGLRTSGGGLHQHEAQDDHREQERDQTERTTDDELRHRGSPGIWVGSTANASKLTLRAVPRQGPPAGARPGAERRSATGWTCEE